MELRLTTLLNRGQYNLEAEEASHIHLTHISHLECIEAEQQQDSSCYRNQLELITHFYRLTSTSYIFRPIEGCGKPGISAVQKVRQE